MSRPADRVTPGQWAAAAVVGSLALAVAVLGTALLGGQWWASGRWPDAGPLDAVAGLAAGTWHWTAAAGAVLALELLTAALLALAAAAAVRRLRRGGPSLRPYRQAARRMSGGRDRAALQMRAEESAARLGIGAAPGVRLGRHLPSGRPLVTPWEYLYLVIATSGRHKTSALVVPQILRAPGACLATSVKGDVVEATRLPRSYLGACWVFDPQQLAGEPPAWWWNPLADVRTLADAEDLTAVLVEAGKEAGEQARRDGFFDPKGRQVLASTLLAAALDGHSLVQAYLWLADRGNSAPERVLTRHGMGVAASGLAGMRGLSDKTADGIWATAEIHLRWVRNEQVAAWVVPQGEGAGDGERDPRPRFDPAAFAVSSDTLYLISQSDGASSAAPVTTALTAAVLRAADRAAAAAPGGRLPVPLCGVLDEVANVCRWHELPELYSHYRSKGIWLATYLQTWSQGLQLWGEHRLNTLADNAQCVVYGGGITDEAYLERLSKVIGEWDAPQTTRTSDERLLAGTASVARSTRRERILDVADLAALPERHMVVTLSGSRPMMATAEPYWETELAEAVAASQRLYGRATAGPESAPAQAVGSVPQPGAAP
ncbi:type IV secretory system conjugative DNA transfer family protein [Streptomyces sp. NPDC001380]|uniref:type IV secretory system conjugative DNA transfer family protein n=1 Tax=Streptomyces sp. NPDC001380 TaxID=3364566 RepID=UPI0036CEF180